MPYYVTRTSDYFDQKAQPNLRTYFGRVVKGQSEIYDTPFAKGESTAALLQGWMKVLRSINDKWPSLYEFEIDMANHVGPLSVMLPLKQRMNDIRHYYDDIHLSSAPIADYAINEAVSEWRNVRGGVRMRSMDNTVDKMKKSTNSGSPFFTKRRQVVGDTIPVFNMRIHGLEVFQALPTWDGNACAVLGWRGQEGGHAKEDVKQRVVWMFPFAVNIKELQVYQPLIEAAQRANIVPAWVSMDAVDDRVTSMFDSKDEKDLVVCTDFTKFDQHFNEDLQSAAQIQLESLLTRDRDTTRWLREIFPIKYMIPLMYDYGKVRRGKHGMASGSGGTNADETLAHRALQLEAAHLAGAKLNPNSQCLGDDGILTYPGITVEDVVAAYTSHGLDMNSEKQYASTQDCVYLRRWHHNNYRVNKVCVGVYSTCRALGRLRYLERWMDPEIWSAKGVALRQLSIMENVKWHPLKEEFVRYCMKRDKYRLGIDIPDFLDNIEGVAKEFIDYMPDFLGYVNTLQAQGDPFGGIANWWIVKYLKSMR